MKTATTDKKDRLALMASLPFLCIKESVLHTKEYILCYMACELWKKL